MDNLTASAGTAAPKTPDEIVAAFEAESAARAAASAAAVKAADVEAIKKLTEYREKEPGVEFVILGDATGGPFRGVFCVPTVAIWKSFQDEARSEHQRPNASHNLVVRCLKWPALGDLEAAVARRPALINVISGGLALQAGSGMDAHIRK